MSFAECIGSGTISFFRVCIAVCIDCGDSACACAVKALFREFNEQFCLEEVESVEDVLFWLLVFDRFAAAAAAQQPPQEPDDAQ